MLAENPSKYRIIVVGGGPVGLLSALGLVSQGHETVLITPQPGTAADNRTAALFLPSLTLLESLGVFAGCRAVSAPLKGIRIIDDRGGLLRAPEVLFSASEIGAGHFGLNIPNAALNAATRARLQLCAKRLTWIEGHSVTAVTPGGADIAVTLSDGRVIRGALVIGADGRQSICRAGAQIAERTHRYDQVAVTATFTHQRPHDGISTEFHGPAGPCTTVPLPGRASSLVWVERPALAARLRDMDDGQFIAALERRLQGLLGPVSPVTARGMFPLSWMKAETTAARRVMLVGEAAHVMPPIGAQGLNLGLRDVGFMIDCVRDAAVSGRDPGGVETLAAYNKSRAGDITMRMTAVDGLNRSLLTDFMGVHLARGLGLHLVAASARLRRELIARGIQPDGGLPKLMLRPAHAEASDLDATASRLA